MKKVSEYYKAFSGRSERYDFLRVKYAEVFASAKKILDVGCDDNYLKQYCGDKVFGIDVGGTPDKVVDLEKESLRFLKDKSFDFTICTEVLEHIDNLHEVFADILRVTDGIVIISLPNTISRGRMRRLLRSHKTGKFYGLPFEKPVDRHKWYMSYKEITAFFEHHCREKNIHLQEILYHYPIIFHSEKNLLRRIKQIIHAKILELLGDKNSAVSVFVVMNTKKTYKENTSIGL